MATRFQFGNALLFRTPVWVDLKSDPEVGVLIKPLKYADVCRLRDIAYLHSKESSLYTITTQHSTVAEAIIDTKNAIGFPTPSALIAQLPPEDIQYLYTIVLELSSITKEQLDALDGMLEVQFNPQFSDDSWNCEICKAKGLDYNRACGFLPKDKRDPNPALPRVGSRRFTECPISMMDVYVANQASLAHSLFSSGMMPESGGLSEQTEWFIKASLLYKRKISEAERQAAEDAKTRKK